MSTTFNQCGAQGSGTLSLGLHQEAAAKPADELLDSYVMERIDFLVRKLARQYGLQEGDWEDVRQDLTVGVLEAAAKFDPARASWHTFASRALSMCYKRFCRDAAGRRECTVGDLLNASSSEDPSASEAYESRSYTPDPDSALDIPEILKKLPPRTRQVCELLQTMDRAEVARTLAISRVAVHLHVKKAREVFERAFQRKAKVWA